MVKFTDNFWGEKFQGYDVLYHNMKHGQRSCSEFIEFVKERMLVEENYSKQLAKLSRQVGSNPSQGTFSPYWQVLRQSTEKTSTLHQQLVLKLQELLKEMQKYLEEQSRKHKTMKDAEIETANVVQAIQNQQIALLKSKEAYLARNLELEKCRKENAGPKDVERAEARLKKATEDYRSNVEKYASLRVDFDKKMTNTSQHFQDLEEQHLRQMLQFADIYGNVIDYCWNTMQEVASELKIQTQELTIDKLLSIFIDAKATGAEKPVPIEFEEVNSVPSQSPAQLPSLLSFDGDNGVSGNNSLPPPSVEEPVSAPPPEERRRGILRKQRMQKFNHVGGGNAPESNNGHLSSGRKAFMDSKLKFPSIRNIFSSNGKSHEELKSTCRNESRSSASASNGFSKVSPVELDRNPSRGSKWFFSKKDGTKKDKDAKKETKKTRSKNKGKETLSSMSTPTIAEDAKSESSFGSHSYDQSSVSPQVDAEGFVVRPSDTGKSRSDSYEQYKSSSDSESEKKPDKLVVVIKPPTIQPNRTGPVDDRHLLNQAAKLQLGNVGFSYTGGKRASTRIEEMMKRSTSMSSDVMESRLNAFDPFTSPLQTIASSTAQNSFAITPQRTGGSTASNPWDSSPDFSLLSQTAQFQSLPAPPLPFRNTLQTSATVSTSSAIAIPLAVAFVEKISAHFVGADETKCRTRIEGDLILTFPSGVLQMLLSNPNHPALRFCLTQTSLFEHILPNKHLVTQETQIDDGRITYTFNMINLTNQLRKQAEAKAVPQPYQNIPVMKYHVSSSGIQTAPVILVCYWKHEELNTSLRIDYRRNPACPPLRGCQISLPIAPDIDVTSMTSIPSGDWSPHEHVARWNILDPSTEFASIKARFEHSSPSSGRISEPVHCGFQAEGILLSRVLFELVSDGYKVTVVKMRVASARYVCETS